MTIRYPEMEGAVISNVLGTNPENAELSRKQIWRSLSWQTLNPDFTSLPWSLQGIDQFKIHTGIRSYSPLQKGG